MLSFTYAADGSRRKSSLTDNGVNTQTRLYLGACELDVNNNQWIHYISGGDGLCTIVTKDNSSTDYYYTYTDHLGSILTLTDDQGDIFAEQSFDAWGRKRNPDTWGFTGIPSVPNWLYRGYTGHEHLPEFGLIHMNGRMYDPILGRMLSPDNYVHGSLGTQGFNRYSYAGNNPLKYSDPSGEILTWSIGNGGGSLGLNFTPAGVPLGFGASFGWSDGFSLGGYGEVGPRVGGTGLGSQLTQSQGLDYNFKHKEWSTTSTFTASASLGLFNSGMYVSKTYNITNSSWSPLAYGASAGLGVGGPGGGFGANIGFGTGGLTYGIGGYYDSHGWDAYPEATDYSQWNDYPGCLNNNCYSYATDAFSDIANYISENYDLVQPGYSSGGYGSLTLESVTEAAISDGGIKKPNLINKLGFGKKGYYEVYLVIDNDGIGRPDYHWYRRNKGGYWTHKRGQGQISITDASYQLIRNPAKANHHYEPSLGLNYNNGGILLWRKSR